MDKTILALYVLLVFVIASVIGLSLWLNLLKLEPFEQYARTYESCIEYGYITEIYEVHETCHQIALESID